MMSFSKKQNYCKNSKTCRRLVIYIWTWFISTTHQVKWVLKHTAKKIKTVADWIFCLISYGIEVYTICPHIWMRLALSTYVNMSKTFPSNFSTSYQIPVWFDQTVWETHKSLLSFLGQLKWPHSRSDPTSITIKS